MHRRHIHAKNWEILRFSFLIGDATSEDSEEEGSLDSDESEGKDWSDLEEEAARADKRRDIEESGGAGDRDRERKRQHDRERDRKRHHGSKGGPPPKRHK